MAQLVERTLGKGEVPSSTLGISTTFSVKVRHLEKNLSGGCSAVVPPDPMPNSEVKRRSADGSVGSPHARVGNCQASNKAKGSVGRLGLLFYLLFVGEHSPNQDKSAGSGFERCEATARRVAGRTPAINCQTSNQAKGHPKGWPCCFSN